VELTGVFATLWIREIFVTLFTFGIAVSWLRIINFWAEKGVLESNLSRKIIHLGTGPLFVLCWTLFASTSYSRYLAALVPLSIVIQFIGVGTGVLKDSQAVIAMTRNGEPSEILKGPLYYGLVFIICTLVFWRNTPVGILALMIICGGDGLADIVGRRLGKQKLPFNSDKSWLGSLGMFFGSFSFGFIFVALFHRWGYFELEYSLLTLALRIMLISAVATLVEALPFKDIDNLTLCVVVIILGISLL
jgi:phytol kinase